MASKGAFTPDSRQLEIVVGLIPSPKARSAHHIAKKTSSGHERSTTSFLIYVNCLATFSVWMRLRKIPRQLVACQERNTEHF